MTVNRCMCRRSTGAIKQGREDGRAPAAICLKFNSVLGESVSLASLTSDGVQIHAAEELLLPPPQALVILKTQARNEETTHALRRPEVTEMNKIGACGCEALAENGVARTYLVLLELVLDADPGAEVDDLGDLVLVDGVLAAMRQGVAVLHGRHCVLG
jgi:hypothetical protein